MFGGGPKLSTPECRLSSLIFDYFAPQHLFIAEGEGARCILELLMGERDMPGRKAICYADTVRHQSPGYVDRLQLCSVVDITVYATRLALLRNLPHHFALLSGQYRIYVAASTWLISAIEDIAE